MGNVILDRHAGSVYCGVDVTEVQSHRQGEEHVPVKNTDASLVLRKSLREIDISCFSCLIQQQDEAVEKSVRKWYTNTSYTFYGMVGECVFGSMATIWRVW